MTVVAGWILHCELHKGSDATMTHLAFSRNVAMSLLYLKQKLALRPGPRVRLSIAERKTDGHYIVSATQGRCAECKKQKQKENTTNKCHQCEKRLHKNCFAAYHGL
ncbi:piggyBac transposable element-derived protein 2-like [Ixodes scapularis]|uniref:piggyBac transposable element-derived protein 2-like n=1 Tax=Ixodes scapularis TaxID=6945 RepID=UPI001C39188D|nr:piggyBac transposable element-derived protein 2-like [Ixodes scapularis]